MKQSLLKSSILRGLLSLFFLVAMVGNAWGEDATMTAGTNGSSATVNSKTAIKVGTSSKGGTMTITVPAGATSLDLYAAAWNGVTGLSLNITPTANVNTTSIALTADAGISGSSPFTLSGDEADYKFTIPLNNITSQTTLTFTSSTTKRFVVWGATYTSGAADTRTAVNMSTFTTVGGVTSIVKGNTLATSVTNDQSGWTAAYTYSSNNTNVATVAADGTISAVAKGTAKITASLNVSASDASYKAGTTTSKSIDITVTNPMHSVTWYVNGSEYTTGTPTTQVEEGNKVTTLPTAPTSTDATSTTFVGWSTSEVTTKTNTAPSVLFKDAASAPAVSGGDVVYHAVFAKATEGGQEGYSVTTTLTTGKTYIFGAVKTAAAADLKNNQEFGAVAVTNDYNATSPTWGAKVNLTPDANGVVATTNVTDACKWTLESVTSGNYAFKKGDKYFYLHTTKGSSSAANVGLNTSAQAYLVDASSTCKDAFIIHSTSSNTSTKLMYNTSNGYRAYDNSQSASATMSPYVRFYEYNPGVTYNDYITKIATPLSAPTLNDVSGIHATSATITWSAVSNADGYQYKIGDGDWQTAGNLTQELTGLTAGTEYTVSVRANGSGDYCDSPAASKTFTTLYSVTAASSNNEWGTAQVSLNNTDWASSVETTKGTTVYVKATPASAAYAHSGWQTTSGTIADGQLTGWTTIATVTAQFALAQRAVLNTPTGMKANAGVISTTVSWTAVEHASSYKLIFNGTTYDGLTVTSKEITGLTAGTTYKWTVQAIGDGVSYDNSAVCAEQSFTTTAKALESIAIETAPTKTYYLKGDAFAKDGMVVKATYNNGDVETVAAENYTVSPATFTTTGEQNVTVSFTYNEVEKTTTQAVNIKEKWAVKFVAIGSENTLYETTPDAGITPPTTSKIGDYTFQFWSETNQTEETTTAPDKITLTNGKYVPTEAKTFYAVYAMNKEVEKKGMIISYVKDATTNYLGSPQFSKSSGVYKGYFSTTTSLASATTIYREGNKLFYMSGTTKYYIKGTSSSDLNRVESANDATEWTISEENDLTSFYDATNNRYIGYNNRFACYIGTTFDHDFTVSESESSIKVSTAHYTTAPSSEATPTTWFATNTPSIDVLDGEGNKNTYKQTVTTNSSGAVTYSSSNETIATVASDGTVTAVKGGEVTITATVAAVSSTWRESSASYTLTINKMAPTVTSGENFTLYVGETVDVSTLFTTNSDGAKSYSLSSSSYGSIVDNVYTVAGNPGNSSYINVHLTTAETDIYAAKTTTANTGSQRINLRPLVTQTISFANTSYTFALNEEVADFTNTLTGAKTTVNYSSSNESIATVDGNGLVHMGSTASAGTITISATAVSEKVDGVYYKDATKSYTITIMYGAPTFSLAAGEYHSDQLLELSATGAEYIYYTTDGTTPTFDGSNGTGREQDLSKGNAIIALEKGNTTVKAIAVYADNDFNFFAGAQGEATYTLVAPAVPTVSFENNATVDLNRSITLSSAEGTKITYSVYDDDDFLVAETTSANNSAQFTASKAGEYTVEFKSTWAEKDGYSSNTVQYTLKVAGPAAIPFAYNDNATNLPTCFSVEKSKEIGDYSTENTKIALKESGTSVTLWYASAANTLSFDAMINGDWNNANEFVVSTSTNGSSWTALHTFTGSVNALTGTATTYTFDLPADARYIKWEYGTKSSGNVGFGNIFIGRGTSITIAECGYTTVCLPYNAYAAEGATTYALTDITAQGLVFSPVDTINANEGYLIKGTANASYNLTETLNSNKETNMLEGVTERTSVSTLGIQGTGDYAYPWILAKDGKFKKYTGEAIPANKAYLDGTWIKDYVNLTSSSSSELRVIFADETNGNETALKAVESVNEENTIYNISGQRVNKVQKSGLYIVNGKTQLIKK